MSGQTLFNLRYLWKQFRQHTLFMFHPVPRVIQSISQLYNHSEKTEYRAANNDRQRLVLRDRALSVFLEVICWN